MKVSSDLRSRCWFQTGGSCAQLFEPESEEDLGLALKEISQSKRPFFILGRGSNSLVMDDFWDGAVLSMARLQKVRLENESIICEAGVENTWIAEMAWSSGLEGVAWMNRLPGQMGATVRMNARCYGGEISQVVSNIRAFDFQGQLVEIDVHSNPEKVFRSYKNTIFMDQQLVVYEMTLDLKKGCKDSIRKKMDECEQDRLSRHQFDYPSCGCVFKNDYSPEVSVSSGFLLDLAGARDLSTEHARVSPWHANFIFNQGGGSREILELSLKMRELVWNEFGIWLDYEMEMLGQIPEDLKQQINIVRKPDYKTAKLSEARRLFASR